MSFLTKWLGDVTWDHKRIPSLAGKHAIVTGGNSGLGYVDVKRLAEKGAHVVLAGRDEAKCRAAIERIRGELASEGGGGAGGPSSSADTEFQHLDLASFKSVREFSERYRASGAPLHILVNNAGVQIPKGQEKTADGFEVHVGTNFFGHFLLTHLLLDVLKSSAPSRVVFMSSPQEARAPGIPWDDLKGEFVRPGESDMNWYGTANLLKIMAAKEMAARLEGTGVDVFVVQPGTTQTDLFPKMDFAKKESSMLDWTQKLMGMDAERGALSTLYCATEPELAGRSGAYIGPWYGSSGLSPNVGMTAELEPSGKHPEARDPEARSKLYELAAKVAAEALGGPLPHKLPKKA